MGSSKMFGTERSGKIDHSKTLKKFIEFLKQSEKEKENRIEDDLGFEINFGAFQPEPKMPLRKSLTEKTYQSTMKATEKRRTDIPKEFIKKIKNLGMKVEDAEILFKSKIDWTAIYSDNKIYCVEPRCDYFTKMDGEELTNHMINVHKYGDFPCNYDHCDYVAASKKNLISHEQMHKVRSENDFWYKCPKPNCQSTFQYQCLLDPHMRIHNNESNECQNCQYRYVNPPDYKDHL